MLSRSPSPSVGARAFLAFSFLGAACTGSINGDPTTKPTGKGAGGSDNVTPGTGGSGGSGPSTGGAGGGTMRPMPPPGGICKDLDPGPSPMRLLTRIEYDNTVRDLFGAIAPSGLTTEFPADARPVGGYANDISRPASDALVAKYDKAAEKLAAAAVGQMSMVLGGCDPARDGDMTCLNKFLDGFAKRAWRRPLNVDEKKNLSGAFTDAAKDKGFAGGLTAVIEVLLMSPQFLYRYEQGIDIAGTKYAQLTSFEVASRLSYLLWGSMPDAELMTAAEANKLTKPEEILVQARRMVNDGKHMPVVKDFVQQLLHLEHLTTLEKDPELKQWNAAMREPMFEETNRFIQSVFSKEGDGKLGTMLTAPYSYLNGPLAAYYGVSGVTGNDFQKVAMPAGHASGFLTHGGFLAQHATSDDGLTSLVFRGKFVKEELLCTIIPDPPPNAELENPPFNEMTTSREWSELRMAKPICGTCHTVMDPIGFTFENFDPAGKWRTQDRGKPVNAMGEITGGTDVDGKIAGVVELGQKLASSKDVTKCVSTQWFRFAAGRPETKRDDCTIEVLQKAMADSKGDLRELLVAFTQTDAFLFRSKGDAP